MLLETLKNRAAQKAGSKKTTDLRIGRTYTAVQLDTGSVGLAYTFRDSGAHGSSGFEGAGSIPGGPLQKALEGLNSKSLLARTVGLATANAVLNAAEASSGSPAACCVEGDLLEVLSLTGNDRVGMVGFFAPLAPLIRERAGELLIFEENVQRAEGLLPAHRAQDLLPECSVVIITATSIITNTFEALASAARSCRVKAVLGPSTPLVPAIFQDYGVTHLSGVMVTDAAAILREVSDGGGMPRFKGAARKINVVLEH